MMPIAIACSFSFMLPAATPVNAIVYDLAQMSIPQMVRVSRFSSTCMNKFFYSPFHLNLEIKGTLVKETYRKFHSRELACRPYRASS